jgi:hypothetical protein
LVEEIVTALAHKATEKAPRVLDSPQSGILDIPSLHLDPRHPAMTMLSREDMYGDDGR